MLVHRNSNIQNAPIRTIVQATDLYINIFINIFKNKLFKNIII